MKYSHLIQLIQSTNARVLEFPGEPQRKQWHGTCQHVFHFSLRRKRFHFDKIFLNFSPNRIQGLLDTIRTECELPFLSLPCTQHNSTLKILPKPA